MPVCHSENPGMRRGPKGRVILPDMAKDLLHHLSPVPSLVSPDPSLYVLAQRTLSWRAGLGEDPSGGAAPGEHTGGGSCR